MSLDELKNHDPATQPVGKLTSIIARAHNIYLNHNLNDLDINATQLHLLFEISCQSNINQENIASRCNINKGAVARSIKKLEEKELIVREIDEKNRRQNKVSLTKKGTDTLNESINIFNSWELEVLKDTSMGDKQTLKRVLNEIAVNAIELNRGDKQ